MEIPVHSIKLASIGEKILSSGCENITCDQLYFCFHCYQTRQTNSFSIDLKMRNSILKIKKASRREEIFSVLELAKCFDIAEQLKYLDDLTNDDPDELPMDLESLKMLSMFFVEHGKYLPEPAIRISPYELLQAEWHSTWSSAVMKFLRDGKIRYAGLLKIVITPKRFKILLLLT